MIITYLSLRKKVFLKILLVYPPIFRSANIYSTTLPLGLLHVATYLQNEGNSVRVLNLENGGEIKTVSIKDLRTAYAANDPKQYVFNEESSYRQEFKKAVLDFQPDLIGFSVATEQIDAANEMAKDAKKMFPNVKIEMGNIRISPSDWVKQVSAAALMIEPDLSFLEGQNTAESFGSVMTSIGCPFSCVYCGSPQQYKRKITYFEEDSVRRRLRNGKNMGAKGFYLLDDTITINIKRAEKIADILSEFNMPWRIQTRVESLVNNLHLISYFKDRGCVQMSFGVESGSTRIRKLMKKNLKIDDVLKGVELLRQHDMPYTANFMIGFPSETNDDVDDSMAVIKAMKPERISCASMVPYHGTELYIKNPKFVEAANNWNFCQWSPFNPTFLTDKEGNRIDGPSFDKINQIYEMVENINDHVSSKKTFSTVLSNRK